MLAQICQKKVTISMGCTYFSHDCICNIQVHGPFCIRYIRFKYIICLHTAYVNEEVEPGNAKVKREVIVVPNKEVI